MIIMKKLCFATNNAHKLQEIQAMLGEQFELISLEATGCKEELPETGNTLEATSTKSSIPF
jgi:XTP/dITP diphosphohydrolase